MLVRIQYMQNWHPMSNKFVKPEWCGKSDHCPGFSYNWMQEMISWRDPVTFGLIGPPDCECKKHQAQVLKPAQDVLTDYFDVVIPDDLLMQLLQGETELMLEIETGGIGDTDQRDMLMDTILRKIGMRSWPTYGEGPGVIEAFTVELESKLQKYKDNYNESI